MLSRAYNVCSNWHLLHLEFEKIIHFLTENDYPKYFVLNIVKHFLYSKYETKIVDLTDERKMYYFKIPYIGHSSDIFKKKLSKLFLKFNIKTRIVFTSTKISTYFSLKDRTNVFLKSCLVYKFTCLRDSNITYIGKTKRHFGKRLTEHGLKGNTSVSNHVKTCENCAETKKFMNCFKILESGNSDFDCKILEAFLIRKNRPCLNKQLNFSGSEFTLKLF